MKNVLNIASLFFVLIILLKVILWLKSDFPINRPSILFLLLIVILLQIRNRITYLLLLAAMVYPFFHRHFNAYMSRNTFEDFTYSIAYSIKLSNHDWHVTLLNAPFYFYVIMAIILLFPQAIKLYGFGKRKGDPKQTS